MEPVLSKCPCEGDYCTDPACDWPDQVVRPKLIRPLTDREQGQVADLNQSIEQLADALGRGAVEEASGLCREVEVEAFALRMMLSGGRR